MGANDFELLDRWRQNDRKAGNELFQRYFSAICRFFQNKIQGEVDELVQRTFLACVRSRDQFRKQSSFRSYLFTIARNELYTYLRRYRREDQVLDFGVTSMIDLTSTPRSRLARLGDRQRLLLALRSLPVEQQMMIELYYWEDMSLGDLGEVLGIPSSTVGSRLFRARQKLQERLCELADSPIPEHQTFADLDAWARALRDHGSGEGHSD